MQNEEQLNKLFNLAREQEVLLNSDEFQELMNGRLVKKPTDKYQKFKAIKIKAMTISTLIIGIAATIGFFVNSNQKSIRKSPSQIVKTVIEPFENSLIETEENKQVTVSPPDITFNSKTQTTDDDTGKKKKIIMERKVIIADENVVIDLNAGNIPKDFSIDNKDTSKKFVEEKFIIKKNEGKDEPKSLNEITSGFEKETFVHLTKEELKKLGIYIKDGVFMYEMEETQDGNIKAYWAKNGMQSRRTSGKKLINGNNPRMAFVTNFIGNFKEGLGYISSVEDVKKEAPKLLPVWLEDSESKDGKVYIAWFEINDKLIELLPRTVQENLKASRDFYKHSLPEQEEEDEFDVANFYNKPLPKYNIDSIVTPTIGNGSIAVDENQIFTADKSLLKKLGFESTTPIKYHRRKKGCDLKLKIEDISMYLSSRGSDKFGEGKSLKSIFPSFVTRHDPSKKCVSDPTCIIKPSNETAINVLQYFANKKYELLGFKLRSGNFDYVFWYEPTEALLKELPETDRKKIEDYIAANKGILDNISINIDLPIEKSFEEIANSETSISKPFEKETFVVLTKEELKRLGIYIKDDVFMYEMDYTRIGKIEFFTGTKNTDYRSMLYSKRDGKNPLALLVTNKNGDIIKPIIHSDKNPDDYWVNISKNLLPVWVEDETSKASKPYIAWFEMNDTLIYFLPERIRQKLTLNKIYYSHLLTDKNKRTVEVKYPKRDISVDKNQIIVPDKTLLYKLGFESTNPVVYYRHTEKGGQLAIDYRYKDGRITIALANQDGYEHTISTMFPAFESEYNFQEQSINKLHTFAAFVERSWDFNDQQYFQNKKYGMVGLWIKGDSTDKIFWYDINDALLNELNPEDKKRIKEYAEANKDNLKVIDINTQKPGDIPFEKVAKNDISFSAAIKTFSLTETQLEKLAINVENKKVVHKIYLGKNKDTGKPSALQIAYDKSGSISTYPINFENFDSASYLYPVMLTDDLGQYARSTINAGKSYELDKISSYNLIPVLVKSGEEYTTMDQLTKKHRPDIIFWYEPTEKFLKILDTKTANEIRNDIVALTCNRSKIIFTTDSTCDGKSTLSCNYFEACQNTTSKAINKYSVFPNPAKDNFNLKLDLKEECSVLVYMFALNGAEVKQFPVGKMNKGISQKELSSEGITPGLYLLRITTDKGDIFNERIVIKE